jgi:threonine dehydrogenase-like Zn-dependent dehydrogenase
MAWVVAGSSGEEAAEFMKALALDYESRTLKQCELAEPRIQAADEVLFRVEECGVCGTDRELAQFHFGYPPEGERILVLGHEVLGQVLETGSGVKGFARGDWVAAMVRRACVPACVSCARGRRDLCVSGGFRERGIFGAHGYFSEFAIDREMDLVRVPAELAGVAVLIEPMSVVEKAVESVLYAHRGEPRTALVVGAGPVGALAALVLRDRGLDVTVFSIEPEEHPRAMFLRDAGVQYRRSLEGARFDVIVEACGSAAAAFAAMEALGPCGAMVLLGAQAAYGEMPFLQMIIQNQTLLGSVNAGPEHFAAAIAGMRRIDRTLLARLIERRRFADAPSTILSPPGKVSKVVHVIAS